MAKLKDLISNENFLSKYGDYEIVRDTYTTVRQNDKLQLVFDIQKPEPKSIWDLEKGENYLFITGEGDVWEEEFISKLFYKKRCEVGNVLLVGQGEEANHEVERRKVETLLLKHGGRRWFDHGRMNYFIEYDRKANKLDSVCTGRFLWQGLIYFDTHEQAENAIEQIGKERIVKALFEVK